MGVKRKSDEMKRLAQIEQEKLDVSNRHRDHLGRFAKMEELKSFSSRFIKLKKIRGSYGSYKIKERWLTDDERAYAYFLFGIVIFIIFI